MTHKFTSVLISVLGLHAPLWAHAEDPAPTEAPAGFDTPTLIAAPGSKSSSNGLAQPAGDTFAFDQQIYETQHDVTTGLGPVYNARACAECHQNPVSGGASQFTEAAHRPSGYQRQLRQSHGDNQWRRRPDHRPFDCQRPRRAP